MNEMKWWRNQFAEINQTNEIKLIAAINLIEFDLISAIELIRHSFHEYYNSMDNTDHTG